MAVDDFAVVTVVRVMSIDVRVTQHFQVFYRLTDSFVKQIELCPLAFAPTARLFLKQPYRHKSPVYLILDHLLRFDQQVAMIDLIHRRWF